MAKLEIERLVVPAGQSMDLGDGWLVNDSGELVATQTTNIIRVNTTDGSDNARLNISSAGAQGSSRGAGIELYGNEHASGGLIYLRAGNSTDSRIGFETGAALRWEVSSDGYIRGNSTVNFIGTRTNDGSDTGELYLTGGGDLGSTRGARIEIFGNENSTEPGNIILKTGSDVSNDATDNKIEFHTGNGGSLTKAFEISNGNIISTGSLTISCPDASADLNLYAIDRINIDADNDIIITALDNIVINSAVDIAFYTNSTLHWTMDNVNGDLIPAVSGGPNIGTSSNKIQFIYTNEGYYVAAGNNPEARMWTGSTTMAFQMDKTGGADFSFSNPTGTERILLGGSAVHSTFTATHKYEIGTSSPQEGDAVKLVNRKLEKCTTDGDPTCVGVMTSEIVTTGISDSNNADSSVKAVIYDSFGTAFDHAVGGPHTLHHVASLGDSYTDFLIGVKVCDDGGAVSAGDLLETCAAKPGFLRKQSDDIIRAKTVAQAIEDVTFDGSGEATGVYVYLKK